MLNSVGALQDTSWGKEQVPCGDFHKDFAGGLAVELLNDGNHTIAHVVLLHCVPQDPIPNPFKWLEVCDVEKFLLVL